ncbi:MAG: CYTH domain-containing protein [Clostridia bacterium]|nr:CYTH domain-containing protein [Clostridia bacterium]
MKDMEIELKLRLCDPSLGEKIISDPIIEKIRVGEPFQVNFETRHYDTRRGNLMDVGLAYRIRKEGERYIACVKGGGASFEGLHRRFEYSVPVEGFIPDINVFAGTPIFSILWQVAGEEELITLFSMVFTRISTELHVDGTIMEMSLDRGGITAGNKKEEICELELELKSGDTAHILKLGEELAEKYPLVAETRSKFQRGLALLGVENKWNEKNCKT